MDSASAKQCMPASIVALFPTSQPKHSLFHSTRSLTLLRFNLYINWIFDVPFVALSVLLHVWVRVCVCGFFFFCFVLATFLGIFLSVRVARNILNAITTITKAKTSTSSRGNNNNRNALAMNNEKLLRISPHRSGAAKQAYPCWSFAVLVLCRRCHEMSASRKSSVTAAPAVH